jgi:L-histidine N-alpha-methyltransferase
LRADRDLVVHIAALDLDVPFAAGEEMRTEISCKFTRDQVESMLREARLRLDRWYTDSADRFGLALARR